MDARTVVAAVVAAVALGGVWWGMRDKWDLLFDHGRDAIRHALAGVLMLGTLAGTVWTFSNGSLSVDGIWESLISVGGIAAALEAGVIYCGLYLGDLDARIKTARKTELRAELVAQRKDITRWFYATAAISCLANLIFRTIQLHNFWAALLPAGAPLVLVILFTIKLRPMPKDYAEINRQSAQRGLGMLATQAQRVMMRSLRKMGRGQVLSNAERAQLALAASFQRAYISGEQAQALDQVIASHTATPRALEAPAQGGDAAPGGQWLTSADLQRLYGISERAAQVWMSQTPGRRKRAHSASWEAPAATIYAAHGVPAVADGSGFGAPAPRRRRRSQPHAGAGETPSAASEPSAAAFIPPVPAGELQLAVFEPTSAAGEERV